MYVYNGFLAHIARSFLRKETDINGYVPLYGEYEGGFEGEETFTIDEEELWYLNRIVTLCKENGSHLYFSQAPNFIPNNQYKEWLNDFCRSNNIVLLSHVDDVKYTQHPSLFVDNSHLNTKGADLYSEQLATEIKQHETANN